MKVRQSTNDEGICEVVIIRECFACEGTGLYVGMAERDGAAVVCGKCKGVGEEEITIVGRTFSGRKKRPGIKKVFQSNPGILISDQLAGGKKYSEWWCGDGFKPGEEMRTHTCPAWWYQSADYSKKPDWEECVNTLGSRFSDCAHFQEKKKCWERFDRERNET